MMEGWKNGRTERRIDGIMEGRNTGRMEGWVKEMFLNPIFQHSNIPLFHYSNFGE
jgi:hypothetical protein